MNLYMKSRKLEIFWIICINKKILIEYTIEAIFFKENVFFLIIIYQVYFLYFSLFGEK